MPHGESSGHGAGGVAGGMRRRPIDPSRKLPLIRSTKELALDDDTKVEADGVRLSKSRFDWLAAFTGEKAASQKGNKAH